MVPGKKFMKEKVLPILQGRVWLMLLPLAVISAPALGQIAPAPAAAAAERNKETRVQLPADYVIGSDDVLAIVFWFEKDLSNEVSVRPDGKISLPLVNDIQAAGFTPEQLRVKITEAAGKFVEKPTVTVIVKQINSRNVFITGRVNKPGAYPLHAPTTVLQLIATAGGVLEYADMKNILIVRSENGSTTRHMFNHKDVMQGKNFDQNIELKPGDTIIVP